jgi:hypothetical protein
VIGLLVVILVVFPTFLSSKFAMSRSVEISTPVIVLSNERLEITKSGLVKLKLKTAYSNSTSHLLFTPRELIKKLSAIIPPPKSHLVNWSGVFAPGSPYRKIEVLKPDEKKGQITQK